MKTDSQLQQDVSEELTWDPSVDAAHIGVEVKDGVVTLSGQVDSFAEKWAAERAAQRVSGVNAMAIDLQVQLSGLRLRSDEDVARSVENVLEWTSSLPKGAAKVKVESGWVTLSGKVDWQFQRQAATDAVRHLMGVMGVSNQIVLEPSLSASVVKSDIEAALKRTSIMDAGNISVDVNGADVTLAGTIHSWADRETATNSVWASPGVLSVIDEMRLSC